MVVLALWRESCKVVRLEGWSLQALGQVIYPSMKGRLKCRRRNRQPLGIMMELWGGWGDCGYAPLRFLELPRWHSSR
jgi:hypothetical protein